MAVTLLPGRWPRYLTAAWLLLLLGGLFLVASVSDVAADARSGLPADHALTFAHVTGIVWQSAKNAAPRLTQYITLSDVVYAVHELVFAILFLLIVAVPFRRRACWALVSAAREMLETRERQNVFVIGLDDERR